MHVSSWPYLHHHPDRVCWTRHPQSAPWCLCILPWLLAWSRPSMSVAYLESCFQKTYFPQGNTARTLVNADILSLQQSCMHLKCSILYSQVSHLAATSCLCRQPARSTKIAGASSQIMPYPRSKAPGDTGNVCRQRLDMYGCCLQTSCVYLYAWLRMCHLIQLDVLTHGRSLPAMTVARHRCQMEHIILLN